MHFGNCNTEQKAGIFFVPSLREVFRCHLLLNIVQLIMYTTAWNTSVIGWYSSVHSFISHSTAGLLLLLLDQCSDLAVICFTKNRTY